MIDVYQPPTSFRTSDRQSQDTSCSSLGMTWIRAAVASACVCFILPAGRVIFHSKEEVVLGVGDGWLDVLALQLSPTSAPSPSGVVSLVSDVSGV